MPAKGMDGMTSPKSPDNQISINDNAEGGISISAADGKENEDLKDGTNSTLNNMKTPKLPKTTAKEKPRKRLATKTKTSTAAKPKTKASQRIKPRYVPLFTSPLLSTIGRTASATTNNLEPPIGGSSHPVTAKIGQLNPEWVDTNVWSVTGCDNRIVGYMVVDGSKGVDIDELVHGDVGNIEQGVRRDMSNMKELTSKDAVGTTEHGSKSLNSPSLEFTSTDRMYTKILPQPDGANNSSVELFSDSFTLSEGSQWNYYITQIYHYKNSRIS